MSEVDLPRSVPLGRHQDVLWAVDARVGNHEGTFLLDTGAGLTTVDAGVAKRLGLRTFGRMTGHRMSGERIDIARCEDVPVEIGGLSIPHETVGVADLASLLPEGWPPVAGAIGLTSFEARPATLDFAGGRLVLETPESAAARAAGMVPLRVRIARPSPGIALDVFVCARAPLGPLWLEMDSGNTGPTLLDPHAADALGLAASAGPCEIDLPDLGPTSMGVAVKDLVHDGVLGAAFFSERAILLDLARGRVWASRP